jgi:hypothetical protein
MKRTARIGRGLTTTRRALMLAVIGATTVLTGGVMPAAATVPGTNGRIAFATIRDDNSEEIYVMNADGSNQTRLTNNTVSDGDPAWSPDGTRIAFTSTRGGNSEIYVMWYDGFDQMRLTTNGGEDPAWSPDGARIAFASARDAEIYAMNADGSDQTRLTTNTASDEDPAWSPDGARIAFVTNRDGNYDEIYVMNADGFDQTRLTTNTTRDNNPAWSPDGTRIAFATNRDGNFDEIYVMNADGSDQTRLTTDTAYDVQPDWQALPMDASTVAADVTVPSSAACLELSVTSISFGTLPLGAQDEPATPSVTITNCSGLASTLLASATDATGAGAAWTLVDSPATCADTLGSDSYHLGLASADLASPIALGTTSRTIQTLSAGASTTHTPQISTACPGSSGAGMTMSLAITYLATE